MPRAQAETLSFIILLLLELLTRTESIPVDVQVAMKKASSLETFIELLNASDANSVNTVDEVPLTIKNEACKPIEVMVEVPQPKKRRSLTFPVYVKMFRCRGGCDIEPRLSQCVAIEKKKIPVKVAMVSWRKGNSVSPLKKKVTTPTVHLINETRCGCSCKKKRNCDPLTHIWNSKTCRCDCELNNGYCRPPLVWNNYSCKCECPRSKVCHGPGKVWDHRRCKCSCHDTMKCSAGYYLNPETCRCTCHRNWCYNNDTKKRFDKDTIELAKSQEVL